MRQLKITLEDHPAYLLLTLILATLSLLFLFITVHDKFNWNIL